MSNVNANKKSKIDQIMDKLMGLEVNDDENNYGIINRIDIINDNGYEWYKVYTTLGYNFNAGVILQALSIANLYHQVEDNADRDDNVTVLPVGYPDGSRYSNTVFGPRKKRITEVISSKPINNVASIYNPKTNTTEKIDITSHVSSSDSFPEENKTIDQILTPEEIKKYESAGE